MLGRNRDVEAPNDFAADDFVAFFTSKVDAIRAATADKPTPPQEAGAVSCSLSTFRLQSQAEVRALIMTSPIKSCALDPVPTFLLREFVDILLPYVTRIVNQSLRDARVPDPQKHAIDTPRPGLDTMDMANHRPVSSVTFVSKVIERAVATQLHQYLTDNELLPRYSALFSLSPSSFDGNRYVSSSTSTQTAVRSASPHQSVLFTATSSSFRAVFKM